MFTCGSAATIFKDLDQARRMVKLRIKIGVWSQGLDESKREKIHENLRDVFCQVPARHLWYYLKQLQIMQLTETPRRLSDVADENPELMNGPEDDIVKGNTIFTRH